MTIFSKNSFVWFDLLALYDILLIKGSKGKEPLFFVTEVEMFSVIAALLLGLTPNLESDGSATNPLVPSVEIPADIQQNVNPLIEEKVSAIIKEGFLLEQKGNLEAVQELYSAAIRRFPNSSRLQAQYSRVKVLGDIQKRFGTDWHLKVAWQYDSVRLQKFVQDFWSLFIANYVQSFTPSEIFYRETRCMDIALGNEIFCSNVLPNVSTQKIQSFREEIRQYVKDSVIQTPDELVRATMEIGQRFQNRFQRKASLLVLEGLFDFVTSLDSYSEVLLPNQYQELVASVSGNMIGVGISIKNQNNKTEIIKIIPNSPAAHSDLRCGDQIIAISNQPIEGNTLQQVSTKLEGPAGSTISLLVQTKNDYPREIVLIRQPFVISSIEHAMILPNSGGIGYFRLNGFQQNSALEMQEALNQLQKQGMNSLIIDLRGNLGGIVDTAVAISDLFLDEGNILKIKKVGSRFTHQAHLDGTWNEIPLALLIDENSASASEIFAGAIQAHQRGVIVGKRSFGKGAIQTTYQIPESPFIMKLTTAQFFGPKGNRYNYVGVKPNFEVRETGKPIFDEEGALQTTSGDPVLEKAMEVLDRNRRISMK